MKYRVGLFVLLLALVVFWQRSVGSRKHVERRPMFSTSIVTVNPAKNNALGVESVVPITQGPTLSTAQPDYVQIQKIYQQFVNKDNAAVAFFGQTVDQDGKPLSGVNIKVDVLHLTVLNTSESFIGSDTIHIERVTSADGRFEINGVRGASFSFNTIAKSGFETEPNLRLTYGAVGGSFRQPILFKMWPTNYHEQLITGTKNVQIVPDGRPYMISFTNGSIAEDSAGDLKVWVKYATNVVQGQMYDWSCEVNVINGGLIEEKDLASSMYVAPTEGYTPIFQHKGQLKGGHRGSCGERRFYVALNNGKEYGRIRIELHAPYNNQIPGLIFISYAINPSGSRILR